MELAAKMRLETISYMIRRKRNFSLRYQRANEQSEADAAKMMPRDGVPGSVRDRKQQRCCEHDTRNAESQGDIPRKEGEIRAFATQQIRNWRWASSALGTCNMVFDMVAGEERSRP
jgi:hypothetical protein